MIGPWFACRLGKAHLQLWWLVAALLRLGTLCNHAFPPTDHIFHHAFCKQNPSCKMVPDGEAAKVSLLITLYLAGCGGALLAHEMRVAILSAQLRLSQTHHNQHKSSPQPASTATTRRISFAHLHFILVSAVHGIKGSQSTKHLWYFC